MRELRSSGSVGVPSGNRRLDPDFRVSSVEVFVCPVLCPAFSGIDDLCQDISRH